MQKCAKARRSSVYVADMQHLPRARIGIGNIASLATWNIKSPIYRLALAYLALADARTHDRAAAPLSFLT
jgi:hypothetical protein